MKLADYVPSVARSRAAFAPTSAAQPRRTWLDRWLLLGLVVVVALAAFLATAVPRVLDTTLTSGARSAIAATGADGALTLQSPLNAALLGNDVTVTGASDFLALEQAFEDRLPPTLRRVTGPVVAMVGSPRLSAATVTDAAGRRQAVPTPLLRTASIWSSRPLRQTWVRGAAPAPSEDTPTVTTGKPLAVGLSVAVAKATGLDVGARLRIQRGQKLLKELVVSGVFTTPDAGLPVWSQAPDLLAPIQQVDDNGTVHSQVAFFLPLESIDSFELGLFPSPMSGTITKPVIAARFDSTTLPVAQSEVAGLIARQDRIAPDVVIGYQFTSGLGAAIGAYRPVAQAGLAQMSLAVVGVIGVAGMVLLLGAELLVARRRRDITLLRARGASVTAIVVANLAESLLVAGIGGGVGAAAAALVFRTPLTSWTPWWIVVASAALATPVLAGSFAFRTMSQRRMPANRSARRLVRAQAQLQRAVLDVVLLVLAIGAVVALRGRGLSGQVDTGRPQVDVFLAAAPLLVALAITVVLLRIYPPPLRAAAALARRGRRALPVVSSARATQSLTILPLLALTLCIALVSASGLLQTTLTRGQSAAAWQRVGAAARAEPPKDSGQPLPFNPATIRRLAALPGVRHAVSANVRRRVAVHVGQQMRELTLIAVDPVAYEALLADTPLRYDEHLAVLRRPSTAKTVPYVASADTVAMLGGVPKDLFVSDVGYVPATMVGTTDLDNSGWITGPVAYVSRTSYAAAIEATGNKAPQNVSSATLGDTLLLATGPGAAAAFTADPALAQGTVLTRQGWTATRGGAALLHDLVRLLWAAVALIALFGGVVLLEIVVSGAPERGRTLSAMRTLGLHPRQGRWLALGELLPLVVTAAVGGAVAGALILRILGSTLGLAVLSGGPAEPPLQVSPVFVVGVPLGVVLLLVLAVLLEVSVQRRDKLSEVLRLGDGR